MNHELAIQVENLTKIYKLYNKPLDRVKEALNLRGKIYHQNFYALNDVSFNIKKGETVAIIGKNGAGKSTLLKIITGVLTPTTGKVKTNGKIASLLELGAGFNPEYSGIENIYFQGSIMGFTKVEMENKISQIIKFADIGDYINQSVKMYSSGMFARLAFAIAINVKPDILIIDEALSVGDAAFQNKCIRVMENFVKTEGNNILFVSHDLQVVKKFCKLIIWLDDAKIKAMGSTEILKDYLSFMNYGLVSAKNLVISTQSAEKNNLTEIKWINVLHNEAFKSNQGIMITDIALFSNNRMEYTDNVMVGENLSFYIKLKNNTIKQGLAVGLNWMDQLNNIVFTINNYMYDYSLDNLTENIIVKINFVFPTIKIGAYIISVACAEGTQQNHQQHHWIHYGMLVNVFADHSPLLTNSAKIWIAPQLVNFELQH